MEAIDPENAGPVSYSIGGGDDDELFQVCKSVINSEMTELLME